MSVEKYDFGTKHGTPTYSPSTWIYPVLSVYFICASILFRAYCSQRVRYEFRNRTTDVLETGDIVFAAYGGGGNASSYEGIPLSRSGNGFDSGDVDISVQESQRGENSGEHILV